MKKFLLLLVLAFTTFTASFAGPGAQSLSCTQPTGSPSCDVTDCSNPANGFVVNPPNSGAGTYTCGYSDSPTNGNLTICPYIYNGGTYTKHSITNCRFAAGAPINSGLIFLIIAGAGLGAFVLIKKKQQSDLTV
jgi:hypothetical protein